MNKMVSIKNQQRWLDILDNVDYEFVEDELMKETHISWYNTDLPKDSIRSIEMGSIDEALINIVRGSLNGDTLLINPELLVTHDDGKIIISVMAQPKDKS